ncbi:actin-like ATPase domain-containing protein [Sistotremastrum niveocremeum HHB9708]|uniref:Actin-like ATPase domain-containing protein n=1 Tax=Sistotremastrum niveocremeum HHB9708 TaxID=1314777 RepID=A0A164Q4Y2_9AGAM|nr:actin-like ATPase domain-containing protein [Sistotremastrum niveocremeum HHB9708]
MTRLTLPYVFLFFSVSLFQLSSAALLAIDYGGDWIKASVMKPGVPFDVLLNRDSKRKIQSSVGWKKNDRLFASEAYNIATRFPTDSFNSLKFLLGRNFTDEQITSFYRQIAPAVELVETSRSTIGIKRGFNDNKKAAEWSVEELVAMKFAYIKELAESVGGPAEKVKDVVITVPPHFTQFERQAISDAVEIAGMKVLALVNDGTAVAVNYAMTRTFPKQEYHIIYDAGATGISATLVSFKTVDSETAKGKDATQIVVHGVGYDREASGTEMDRRLRDILGADFNSKHPWNDITRDQKGMAKLWKEAQRVKHVLSVNNEASVMVESIAYDIDYKSKVTKAKFEAACEDLHEKFVNPLYNALASAGLTWGEVESVILTGGASRTPMIQNVLKSVVGNKLATNVNADEAAVLGAAFYGASLSRVFKTKEIKVTDISPLPLQVSYVSESATKTRTIQTLVYPPGSKLGTRKTLTLRRKEDFNVTLEYGADAKGLPKGIVEIELTGVADAYNNLTERGAVDPVVKFNVSLSDSGFVSIQDAIMYGEIKDDTLTGKLKGLFGAGPTSQTEGTADAQPSDTESDSASSTESAQSSSTSETPAPEATAAKEKVVLNKKDQSTIHLEMDRYFKNIPPMNYVEKQRAKERLAAVDSMEASKRRKEDARNSLEAYLYRLRDLLGEADTPFVECSTEEERKTMAEKLDQVFEWMFESADSAGLLEFREKRNLLEDLEKKVQHRYKEREAFPQSLSDIQQAHWATRMFLQSAADNATADAEAGLPTKYTPEELKDVETKLKESEAWLNEGVEKQKAKAAHEDPVILTAEMKARGTTLQAHVMKLLKRKAPRPKKTTTSTSESSTTPTATATSGTEESTTYITETSESTQTTEHSKDEL